MPSPNWTLVGLSVCLCLYVSLYLYHIYKRIAKLQCNKINYISVSKMRVILLHLKSRDVCE